MTGPARPVVSATATARRARVPRRVSVRARSRPMPTGRLGWLDRRLNALVERIERLRPVPGFGVIASILIVLSSVVFGTVRGGHAPVVLDYVYGARDMVANAFGFNIASVALSGQKHLTREEILALAGVTGRASLLFLDVADARVRLKTNPWIAEASVEKLYPDRLQITIAEREAFALWQKDGRVGVIAADGTVLEPYVSRRFLGLPLFVGEGAATRAKDFLAVLDRYPGIRDNLRASILVAERRWNLRLKNGIDVRLPEFGVEHALDQLVALDRDRRILSRDITAIDLRLADRVTVRLSDAAAQAREDALKTKKAKAKGGNA
jgi:cell division protein FtsQ